MVKCLNKTKDRLVLLVESTGSGRKKWGRQEQYKVYSKIELYWFARTALVNTISLKQEPGFLLLKLASIERM